ncbi:hypothetical protein D915_002589 [Fasciola hepatica]|uniref:Uncharacterized protein n=1 Tax=Fasciola hepatica TaxID=6192 RepID=A0A4E0S2Q6_FASHE|nr:hypothetical protein D915_002589 [Fasciola hepatica]
MTGTSIQERGKMENFDYMINIHSEKLQMEAFICATISGECQNLLSENNPAEQVNYLFHRRYQWYFISVPSKVVDLAYSRGLLFNFHRNCSAGENKFNSINIDHYEIFNRSLPERALKSIQIGKLLADCPNNRHFVVVPRSYFPGPGLYYVRFHLFIQQRRSQWTQKLYSITAYVTNHSSVKIRDTVVLHNDYILFTSFFQIGHINLGLSGSPLWRLVSNLSWIYQQRRYFGKILTYHFRTKTIIHGPGFNAQNAQLTTPIDLNKGFRLRLIPWSSLSSVIIGCLLVFDPSPNETVHRHMYSNYLYMSTNKQMCVISDIPAPYIGFNQTEYARRASAKIYFVRTVRAEYGRSEVKLSCRQQITYTDCPYPIRLTDHFTLELHLRLYLPGVGIRNHPLVYRMIEKDREAYLYGDDLIQLDDKIFHRARLGCYTTVKPLSSENKKTTISVRSSVIRVYIPYYYLHIRSNGKEIVTNRSILKTGRNSTFICSVETNLGLFSVSWHVRRLNSERAAHDAIQTGRYPKSDPGQPGILIIPYTFTITEQNYSAACEVHTDKGQTIYPRTAIFYFSTPSLQLRSALWSPNSRWVLESVLIALGCILMVLSTALMPLVMKRLGTKRKLFVSRHSCQVDDGIIDDELCDPNELHYHWATPKRQSSHARIRMAFTRNPLARSSMMSPTFHSLRNDSTLVVPLRRKRLAVVRKPSNLARRRTLMILAKQRR